VPPFPDEIAFQILNAELGNLSAIFKSIGPAPVAAASLGQVYRGELADGRDVAVKVQQKEYRFGLQYYGLPPFLSLAHISPSTPLLYWGELADGRDVAVRVQSPLTANSLLYALDLCGLPTSPAAAPPSLLLPLRADGRDVAVKVRRFALILLVSL
jgi:hypothetical protein